LASADANSEPDAGRSAVILAKKLKVGKETVKRIVTVLDANEPAISLISGNGSAFC
jgi:hypothetical protein